METEDTKITINNNNKKKVLDFYPTPWILKKKTQINQTATTIMKNTIFEEQKKKLWILNWT